jgi:hypothetical protein
VLSLVGVASRKKEPRKTGVTFPMIDILPVLKGEDSHGTAPLGWDV